MKVEFLTALLTEHLDEGHDRLTGDFSVRHGRRTIMVPWGFITDYDSVPRIPFAYWLLGGKRHKAAVLHDFLYSTQCPVSLARRGRAWADEVYRDALRAEGVSVFVAAIMYSGVRLGGALHYEAKP